MPNPAPGKFTEQELESAIIELFKDEGYSHVHGETIHRKPDDILLEDDLRTFLNGYYKTTALTESETAKIITQIKLVPSYPLYEGNKTAFTLFNEGFDFKRDDAAKQNIHIHLIDFENIENNIFKPEFFTKLYLQP